MFFRSQRLTAERKQVLSHGGLGTRGVLDNTSTMRGLEEMRRVTRVYRLEGTTGTHTPSLQMTVRSINHRT